MERMIGQIQLPAQLEKSVKIFTDGGKIMVDGSSFPNMKTQKLLPLKDKILEGISQELECVQGLLPPGSVQSVELFGMAADRNAVKISTNHDEAFLSKTLNEGGDYLLIPVALPSGATFFNLA